MKQIECTFYRPVEVNISEFIMIVRKMEEDLQTLCREPVEESSVRAYVRDLLREARPLTGKPAMYFLGLDEPSSMPGDARVDFFYRPTYIGAAIIIRAALLYPDLLEAKAGSAKEDTPEGAADIRHVLPRLLTGCTGRGFTGHGYESLQGLIETLTLFTGTGTAEFVEKYPDLCRTFSDMYLSAMESIRQGLREDTLHGSWGEDYTKKGLELMELWQAHT